MEVFWRLIFGHFLSDFTCQTNYIAAWKRRHVVGLIVHTLTHPLIYLALVWPYLDSTWVSVGSLALSGWTCIGLIVVTHFIEDYIRIRLVLKKLLPDSAVFYLWDQGFHLLVIFLLSPRHLFPLESPWPIVGCLAVAVTHFTTVTLYFIEKDLYGRKYPGFVRKHLTIAVRGFIFGALLLPGPWMALALVPLGLQIWFQRQPHLAVSKMNLYGGNGFALVLGWVAHSLIF